MSGAEGTTDTRRAPQRAARDPKPPLSCRSASSKRDRALIAGPVSTSARVNTADQPVAGPSGFDPSAYGSHSLRPTKVAIVYKRTGNLGACQLLLGHTKLESTDRYLGIEVDDALVLSEQTEV